MKFNKILLIIIVFSFNAEARWYSQNQVNEGEQVFKQNCSICHGQNAESIPNWKVTDANGNYPPPPLNGSAHAWHHDLDLLRKTVREGGIKLGGIMPSFQNRLNSQQIDSAISYFQSKWSDDIYSKWSSRFNVEEKISPTINVKKPTMSNHPVLEWLKKRTGQNNFDEPQLIANKQLFALKIGEQVMFITKDGKYAVMGNLIDLEQGINLTKSILNKK